MLVLKLSNKILYKYLPLISKLMYYNFDYDVQINHFESKLVNQKIFQPLPLKK
jgi:hypothetical protein